MLKWLSIRGYRSVVDVELELGPVTVVQGGNGAGKSNLYRSLVLLRAAATGGLSQTLADEGGLRSALWAGPRRRGPVRIVLAAQWDDLSYTLELGLPQGGPFPLDPLVKLETVTAAGGLVLAQRRGTTAFVRDEDGTRQDYPSTLWDSESMLSQIQDPRRLPVLFDVRERIAAWRTYHHFRTDPAAPSRSPRTNRLTPVLHQDGHDLAPALRTVMEVGDGAALSRAVTRALPGSQLRVEVDDRGLCQLMLSRPGLHRPLTGWELSDGTLRYLALAAALLSPRPPGLMAINEPETSLHEDLISPLAELMLNAAGRSQLWVTTHSVELAEALATRSRAVRHVLAIEGGRTRIQGAHPLGLHLDPD